MAYPDTPTEMPGKRTARDEGRIKRAVAGAEERAANNLRVIDNARQKGTAITREALANGTPPEKIGDIKGSWPAWAVEGRDPTQGVRPPIEGEARMAFARQRAGLPLNRRDEYVLDRYPDGGPWQKEWEEVCARDAQRR